jgi:hypothetical protein
MEVPSRREFLSCVSHGAMAVAVGARSPEGAGPGSGLDKFIETEMQSQKIPGLAACIVKSGNYP